MAFLNESTSKTIYISIHTHDYDSPVCSSSFHEKRTYTSNQKGETKKASDGNYVLGGIPEEITRDIKTILKHEANVLRG